MLCAVCSKPNLAGFLCNNSCIGSPEQTHILENPSWQVREFIICEVASLNETMTCLQRVCSCLIMSKKLIQNPMWEPGVLNRRDMTHCHEYMTMPKSHSLTQTLGFGMENYKKQTGRCFRMEILEATNTMPMGKHDYQQCRFEIYCQNRRILRREKIYFGKVNFRP